MYIESLTTYLGTCTCHNEVLGISPVYVTQVQLVAVVGRCVTDGVGYGGAYNSQNESCLTQVLDTIDTRQQACQRKVSYQRSLVDSLTASIQKLHVNDECFCYVYIVYESHTDVF
jgi:hypothetical protein